MSFDEAAATGVGVLTAFDGIFHHMGLPLPDPENLPEPKNEWALVFGGASAVGRFAVQTLKVCGYKVVTTCSAKSSTVRSPFHCSGHKQDVYLTLARFLSGSAQMLLWITLKMRTILWPKSNVLRETS